MTPFVLQMAGGNGSGKSTLARALVPETGAVVLDHDTTKTAIMERIDHPPAGAVSYDVLYALAADLLAQRHSVILDTPSVYEVVPRRGMEAAAAAGARYYFVECACPLDISDARVDARIRRPSQVDGSAGAAEVRASTTRHAHRPSTGWFAVDTTRPLDVCVADVLAYLATDGAVGPPVAVADP